MNRNLKNAMTLAEIIIVIVLIGILSSIGVVSYRQTVVRARQREAQSMLRLIQHAEEVRRLEMGTYLACADTVTCNAELHLDLPAGGEWTYSVTVDGTAANFCAAAVSANFDTFHINNGAADPTANGC